MTLRYVSAKNAETTLGEPVWSRNLAFLTQKWLAGTVPNQGIMLIADNETVVGYDLRFRRSEDGPAEAPKLEVEWTLPTRTVYFLKDHLG